jgi:SAM-dependent methyltransferase
VAKAWTRIDVMFKRIALLILLASLGQAQAQTAQTQAPPPLQAQTERKTSEPYTGDLSIFETPGRDEKLQINRVMDILGIGPGKNVADIGAGSGWFSVRAARRIGNGTVYAVDINPESIRYIDARAKKEHLANITTILAKADDPRLPSKVNAVLVLKTYHEIAEPITLLRNLRPSLASDARFGVIDRNGNGADHGIAKEVVIQEADEAGYRLLEQYDFVKDGMDYFLVFGLK